MELTWIEDFLALQRVQNFTEAANQRCTTQPAFSRRVQQLEAWLGVELFDRTARPVQLTAAGEEFSRRAQRIREDILDARRIAMSSQSNYQQTVRIFTTTAIAVGVLPKWLKKEGAPNHSIITSSTAGCVEALRQKRADQILLPWFEGDIKDSQLQYKKIADDRLMPIEPASAEVPLALKGKTLAGPLLMHTPGTIFGQKLGQHWAALGISWNEDEVLCESASAEALLALVDQGLGAAWVPESLIKGKAHRCRVPEKLDLHYEIVLVTRSS
jgi:DNA-binding transcriptional LysR family regulator